MKRKCAEDRSLSVDKWKQKRGITSLVAALLVTLCSGCGSTVEFLPRQPLTPKHTRWDYDRCIAVTIERSALVFPMNWWKVYLDYENVGDSGTFKASQIFKFAITPGSDSLIVGCIRPFDFAITDSLTSAGDDEPFRFGEPELAKFFREFRPRDVERAFWVLTPYDTVVTNRKGKVIHRRDMSVHYSILMPDTALERPIESLKKIPGVSMPRRERYVEIFNESEVHPGEQRF